MNRRTLRNAAFCSLPLVALAACGPSQPGNDAASDAALDHTDGSDVVMHADTSTDGALDATADVVVDTPHDTNEPDTAPPAPRTLFVSGGSGDIGTYAIDANTAALATPVITSPGGNPSFLALRPDHAIVVAALEGASQIGSFRVDADGSLHQINRVDSAGNGPAHVAVDATGHWALAANYGGGSVASWPLAADGTLGTVADRETPGSHPHEIVFDPSNHYVFVPCLGSDRVAQFVFDANNGTLTANATPFMMTAAGAGPRHMAFDPSGSFAYLIDELDSTMMVLRFDAANGTLSPIQTLSTLPTGFSGTNTCAEVKVHPSGRWVFGSNRGHDTIAIFARDASTGRLTLQGHQPTGGMTPRHFDLDPTGAWMFVANQGSANVVTFAVDANTGTLTQRAVTSVSMRPTFAGVF